MAFLSSLWRRITPTKALQGSCGKLESLFFESVYRASYLAGTSISDDGCLYQVYNFVIMTMVLLFVAGEIWYLQGNASSLDVIVEQIDVIVMQMIHVFRFKNMRANKHIYKKLANAMESPYFDTVTGDRKELVEYWWKKNDRYFKMLLGLGSCTLFVWFVYPLVDDLEYNLTVAVRLPVDYHTPNRYPIAYLFTMFVFNYVAYFIIVNDLIMQAYLIHLLCQYSVLADCFENIIVDCEEGFEGRTRNDLIKDDKFRQKYNKRLGCLVMQHKFILDNTMELRNTLSAPMLGQVIASGMQICFAAYLVSMTLTVSATKFFMCLLFLGYNMFELFIFCGWCDEIKTKSENIRDAVYCSGWESGLATMPGVRSRLLLVATRASRPLVLTAGGFYDLSLQSYADLVKTSYSALTVLLRLRHD